MKSSLTPLLESFKSKLLKAELEISDTPESYRGLSLEALCTPIEDLLQIFEDPLVVGSWVDLGSGFGHSVLAYAERFPERKAIGMEIEFARIEVARALAEVRSLPCQFIEGDLLTDPIPYGDIYFLYFPQGHVLDRILSELSKKKDFLLIAIESHGDLFPRLQKETWLDIVREVPLTSMRHHPSARFFRPNKNSRVLAGLHSYSFHEKIFLLKDDETLWWGESLGLCASGDQYLLKHPPRTICESELVKIMTKDEIDAVGNFLLTLRRRGELQISVDNNVFIGALRKIIVWPAFSVEFSSGERVEWSRVNWIKQGNHLCFESSSGLFSLPPAL